MAGLDAFLLFFTHAVWLARLEANGYIDTTFNPALIALPEGFGLAIQPDGKILFGDSSFKGVARFYPDGTLDTVMQATFSDKVFSLALDANGRIYISAQTLVFQFSGQFRVNVPAATAPIVLERAPGLIGGWLSVKTLPADTAGDYADYGFPASGNAIYRVRPQ